MIINTQEERDWLCAIVDRDGALEVEREASARAYKLIVCFTRPFEREGGPVEEYGAIFLQYDVDTRQQRWNPRLVKIQATPDEAEWIKKTLCSAWDNCICA